MSRLLFQSVSHMNAVLGLCLVNLVRQEFRLRKYWNLWGKDHYTCSKPSLSITSLVNLTFHYPKFSIIHLPVIFPVLSVLSLIDMIALITIAQVYHIFFPFSLVMNSVSWPLYFPGAPLLKATQFPGLFEHFPSMNSPRSIFFFCI